MGKLTAEHREISRTRRKARGIYIIVDFYQILRRIDKTIVSRGQPCDVIFHSVLSYAGVGSSFDLVRSAWNYFGT